MAVIGLVFGLGSAHAQPSNVFSSGALSVEWNSNDASCADASSILTTTRDLLGGQLPPRSLQARADVVHEASGWRVRLVTVSDEQRGEREIMGESCAAIQRAVALILVLVLEPEPLDAPPAGSTSGRADTRELPPPPPPVSLPSSDRPLRRRRPPPAPPLPPLHFSISAHGSGGLGVTPGLGFAAGGALGVSWGSFEFGVEGRYWFPRQEALGSETEGDPGPSIRVQRQELQAYACWRGLELAGEALTLGPCVAPGGAHTQVDPVRFSKRGDGSKLSILAGLSLRLQYLPQESWFVQLSPTLVVEHYRDFLLVVDGVERRVYSTEPVSGNVTLSLGVRF